ncbi:replicative helicase loader/inhibitor [Cohnella lubricantis]|uniref:Replicative helicase inhibitor G39P N-terminal domain-containing protein n=1 Tax=Cohnella lubricantis TaxID=2163172 RepID=A0A841T8U7_9BACL|nr:replicative helicase loader/inhibitor [Cohnella lubricantis]MBB6676476.1 hypothetical protein [Cohnella lubricantis]MBP2117093.1 hypothetical protein [Cohnella lubricantis]
MDRADVIELFIELKTAYPNFDDSDENIDLHFKYLKDFPFGDAMKNVEKHILTERFPPTIADIRGRLGDLADSQRSKEAAESFAAQIELWKRNAAPPPDGYWETMKAKLRGDSA